MHPGPSCRRPGLSAGRHIGDRDLEVRAKAVKFPGAKNLRTGLKTFRRSRDSRRKPRFRPASGALLAGAGGVGLERADALGERSTALGEAG
jgi:hypothetical protein